MKESKQRLQGEGSPDDNDFTPAQVIAGGLLMAAVMIGAIVGVVLLLAR